mmetsp:Transcript_2246/g.5204  ORF Transcript_2246/g.5204 Transcript_2246/m.5204 type:complete len:204 (-) Transcript_2246:331-942(-)
MQALGSTKGRSAAFDSDDNRYRLLVTSFKSTFSARFFCTLNCPSLSRSSVPSAVNTRFLMSASHRKVPSALTITYLYSTASPEGTVATAVHFGYVLLWVVSGIPFLGSQNPSGSRLPVTTHRSPGSVETETSNHTVVSAFPFSPDLSSKFDLANSFRICSLLEVRDIRNVRGELLNEPLIETPSATCLRMMIEGASSLLPPEP